MDARDLDATMMRFTLRRPLIAVACGIALVTTLAACGSTEPVSLGALASNPDAYTGDQVSTHGVVQRFVDPTGSYYVLQDAQLHRVELRPASRVSGDAGREVNVTGSFTFSPDAGRFIDVESVSPSGD